MADPTGRKARQQMGAGTARTHLENCTGKKLISAKYHAGRFQSEGGIRNKSKKSGPHLNSLRNVVQAELARSSEQERRVDARALIAEEGRDKLRKAWGSCK